MSAVVTGGQTCALPICSTAAAPRRRYFIKAFPCFMRCGELSAPERGCPWRWSKKSAGVVFRERDSSHPLPFGLRLSKPFTSFERKVEPFDRLRANGGG